MAALEGSYIVPTNCLPRYLTMMQGNRLNENSYALLTSCLIRKRNVSNIVAMLSQIRFSCLIGQLHLTHRLLN